MQRTMVAAGDDLDHGVAAELGERLLQEPGRPFEVEVVHVAHDDVELALAAWGPGLASCARGPAGCRRLPTPWQPPRSMAPVLRFQSLRGRPSGPTGLKTASNEPSWLPQSITSSICEKRSK